MLAFVSGWWVLLPFVQPWNSDWISWDSCRGSKYEQWLGRLGVTMSCIIRMFGYKQEQKHCQKQKADPCALKICTTLFSDWWEHNVGVVYVITRGPREWNVTLGRGWGSGRSSEVASLVPCGTCTAPRQNWGCGIPAVSMNCWSRRSRGCCDQKTNLVFWLKIHECGQSQKVCFGNLSLHEMWIFSGRVSVFLIWSYLLYKICESSWTVLSLIHSFADPVFN